MLQFFSSLYHFAEVLGRPTPAAGEWKVDLRFIFAGPLRQRRTPHTGAPRSCPKPGVGVAEFWPAAGGKFWGFYKGKSQNPS